VQDQTLAERRAAMTLDQVQGRLWAQRLKRVFNIDIETCTECASSMRVIAPVEDPVVIRRILDHLKKKGTCQDAVILPQSRGPPQVTLFD